MCFSPLAAISPFAALMSGGRTAKTIGGGMLGGLSGAMLANSLGGNNKPKPSSTGA